MIDHPAGNLAYDIAGKTRSLVPSSGIAEKVANAAAGVIPGVTTTLFSGQEPRGVAPAGAAHRHPLGYAGDFRFSLDSQPVTDPVAMHDIAMAMAAQHNANIGYSQTEYMGPGAMHVDTMPIGGRYPGARQWEDTALSWADNLNFARETGIGPTPYAGAPTPSSREVAMAEIASMQRDQAARQQMGRTPAEAGTSLSGPRPSETPVAAMADTASRMPAFEKPSIDIDRAIKSGLMSAGPYSPAEGFATATDPNASITTAKVDRLPAATQAPSTPDLASAYAQLGSGLAAAGVKTLAGLPATAPAQTPMASLPTSVPSTIDMTAANTFQPQKAPLVPDLQIATVKTVKAPPLAPPRTIRTMPVAGIRDIAMAPASPRFSASDIYGGAYGSGLASDGSTVSRDPQGITSVTNRFGVTTAMTPAGKQSAYGGDPISGAGGSTSLFGGTGFDSISPRSKNIAVGTAVGAAVGGVPGALMGGWLGSKLSTPSSLRTVVDNPMMGDIGMPSRLGDFPDAPSRTGGLGGFGGFLSGLFGGNTAGDSGKSSRSSGSSGSSKSSGRSFGGVRSDRLN